MFRHCLYTTFSKTTKSSVRILSHILLFRKIRNRVSALCTYTTFRHFCVYLGHCINDKLIDDDDMARQRKQIYAQGNALVRKFYKCTETVTISLFKSYCSSLYTSSLWCNYRSESLRKLCVAYNNVFRKINFLLRDCSASLVFATRDLPTCKILIRKHAYKSVAEPRNVILHSIVRSDSLFTSPLWQHWRNLLYVHPF